MAFGTGTHPTTQLCLELMEKIFEDGSSNFVPASSIVRSPGSVIDVGCGSGILSIAALKLGAKSALGVDIDAGSIVNARENAEANEVGDELMLEVGSVQEILDGRFAFRQASLVLANILAPVIVRLFDSGLARLIDENGMIILSGILEEQASRVIEAAQAKGLKMNERKQMGDWVAFSVSR
jgi:ribosomal protein L11 methyltransferase